MTLQDAPLGHEVAYPDRYDPSLLFPIDRAPNRAALGIAAGRLPFDQGVDIWNAYEVSWLDARGKPRVALATFTVPAHAPRIIESKSFKLYLNSYNQERLPDAATVAARMRKDLGAAAGGDVGVRLVMPAEFASQRIAELDGDCLDDLDVEIETYTPAPERLRVAEAADVVEETLMSRLLKSNCPVTGQPDWGSVQVRYRGPRIDRAGLLAYIVSFRQHADFHEHCVERMFTDILRTCRPEMLSVYARYTRRGGLDINPWRATAGVAAPADARTARQ
ncbi:NADPH-dependent 7-cyano-7-deazaguanine reductase QueF [Achromobacter aloeverae]|uniref:NADPH-dependent 7-cyano-7-deazaguanine reductase n=1 Tax=Achromobacter aloeverae TaxID=1750518 RepID=A0A4V1MSS3_9BURK|nr:NADPH-dependent 7-cyano-7-deazaguanine reductase QueF [Achromobacter aloeverae]RXN93040.1 NADPH-dependent 7-cyano-7-deazaguanine reductase QueF [Achromobacter aloeverae]